MGGDRWLADAQRPRDFTGPRAGVSIQDGGDVVAGDPPGRSHRGWRRVTEQSGRHKTVRIRRACKKDFRNTLHLFAFQSINQSAWARAYYDLARARGQSHALALRNLPNKWLKIIYRMWQNREPYDEQRYLRQLNRKGSPIARRLGLATTGG